MDYAEMREETLREHIADGNVRGFSALGFPTNDAPDGSDFHYLLVINLKSRSKGGMRILHNTRGKPRAFARAATLFSFIQSIGVDLFTTDILFHHTKK